MGYRHLKKEERREGWGMDSGNDRVGTRVGGTKHSVLMLIFYKFLLLTPSINMEDFVAKKAVFYLYKKKTDYMHGFLFSRLSCLYLFCLRKTASSSKGLDTFTDWAFPLTSPKGNHLRQMENYINI